MIIFIVFLFLTFLPFLKTISIAEGVELVWLIYASQPSNSDRLIERINSSTKKELFHFSNEFEDEQMTLGNE
jgi:predicted DNA-binding transcriptional regulator